MPTTRPSSSRRRACSGTSTGSTSRGRSSATESPSRRCRGSSTRFSYTPDFLKCYERGAVITGDTFAPGAEVPMVELEVNLHSVSESVSEVTFDIDGASKTYRNTPQEWLHTQWPAKEPKARGGMVRVRGYASLDEEIDRPGDFGFFRLLDAATSIEPGTEGGKPGGTPTIVVTWNASIAERLGADGHPPAAVGERLLDVPRQARAGLPKLQVPPHRRFRGALEGCLDAVDDGFPRLGIAGRRLRQDAAHGGLSPRGIRRAGGRGPRAVGRARARRSPRRSGAATGPASTPRARRTRSSSGRRAPRA